VRTANEARTFSASNEWAAEAAQPDPTAPDALLAWEAGMPKKREPERRQAGELVYKTYERQPIQQQEQIADLSPPLQERWDRWADARIKNVFAEQPFTEAQGEILVHVIAALREEFSDAIAALRADLTVQTAIARGESAATGSWW
jgi:hypothetical protein